MEFGQIKCTYDVDCGVQRMLSMDLLADSPQVLLVGEKVMLYDLMNRKRRVFNGEIPTKMERIGDDEILLVFKNGFVMYNLKN